jgi:hypothetical protein
VDGEVDLVEALRFLNAWAYVAGRDALTDLPGVRRARVLYRGMGGWVRLSFYGYTPSEPLALTCYFFLTQACIGVLDGSMVAGVPIGHRHVRSRYASAVVRP